MADANIIIRIVDQTRGGIGGVVNQVDRLNTSTRTTSSSLETMQRRIVAIGTAIATSFVARNIIETTARFEDLRTSLNAVTGSAQAGGDAFAFIQDFATRTQFGVEDLTRTFIALRANGLTPTESLLTTFTDTAAISTDQLGVLEAMTRLFARAAGGAAINLEELDMVAERGPPVYRILEEQLGITRDGLTEFGKTAEGSQLILDALIEGLNQEFGGATQARLGNLSTAMSNFGIAVTNAMNIFGQGFAPELRRATVGMTDFITKNEELIRSLGELVGRGLNLVIENFDKVITAVGLFFGAFAISKIVDITRNIAGLASGILALNRTMLTNPIALAIAAISAAVLLLITHWDDLKGVAERAFRGIEIAGLTLNRWFIQFLDFVVNDVVNGFLDMGRRAGNVLSALAKAALDPLNAFEVFRAELAAGEEQIRQNQIVTVDFSGRIEELDRRIAEASATTDSNTGALGENEDQTNMLGDATDDLTRSTDDATDATDDHTDALENNTSVTFRAGVEADRLRQAQERATSAINSNIQALRNETTALDFNAQERMMAERLIRLQEEALSALRGETVRLSETQRTEIYRMVQNDEYRTSSLEGLTQENIALLESEVNAYIAAEERREEVRELERQRERALSDFTRDTERLNQSYYEATTSRAQQLTDSMNDYIRRAREQNRLNNADVQRAIQEYERQINDARRRDHEELMRDYESDLRDFRNEYSAIYDDIYGVLEDWTGKSRSELDRYNQYAKLLFGVDLLGSFNTFVDGSLMSIAGWNTQATGQIQGFGNNTNRIMGQTGQYIGNTVFGPNGVAQRGIGGFIGYALNAFGANGGGLLGAVMSLFGGLGSGLQGLFGNIFGFIGNGLRGFGGFLNNLFGGIANVGGNLVRGIIDFGGSIIGAFTDMFFADGGYIRPGSVGIVGETGPEIVRGPAMVTSAADTESMLMGGGGSMQVNFTINALDARGVDDLLIERKSLIADIMRDAVASSGRGLR